ncbi:MAG: hypothetical protein JWN89_316 [Parcubacteria group bacterium]|nr:hypothetical protein [Parcubacteria group bacterium]
MHIKNLETQIVIITLCLAISAALIYLYIKKIPHPTPRPVPAEWIRRMQQELPPFKNKE